jgi:hypothetical protein
MTLTPDQLASMTIVDILHEASNGLTMGWSAANVPDDEARKRA